MTLLARPLVLIALIALLTPLCVAQRSAASSIRPTEPIILGLPARGWPPYYLPYGESEKLGILADIFLEAALKTGATVELHWLPEKRVMQNLAKGRVEVYTKAKGWVPEPLAYLWSAPIIESEDVLLFRRGEEIDYRSPADLADRAVGTVLGYRYPCLEGLFEGGRCTRMDANNAQTQMKMLQSRRTDVAVINRHVAQWLIRETGGFSPDQFSISERSMATADIRYVFNMGRAWGSFIRDLDREIAAMRADGRFETILDKYR